MIERRDRARRLLWAGDVAAARDAYDEAVREFPGAAALYAARAAVRDPRGAKEDIDRALALDPRCADALLARARMASDPRAALEDAEAALRADPWHVPALYWRALWRAGFGEEEAGRADLKAVCASTADDLLSLQYRAFAAAALGEHRASRSLLDRVIEAGVAESGVLRLRARLSGWLREAKRAVRDWTAYLEKRPDDVLALVERSTQQRLLGYPTDAMRDLERAIELAPQHPTPLFCRALARFGGGGRPALNEAGALEDLERAAQASVEDVESFYFRGRAKEELGRRAEARMDYERALAVAPPYHWLRGELVSRARPERAAPAERGGLLQAAPMSVLLAAVQVTIWLAQGEPLLDPDPDLLLDRGGLARAELLKGEVWRLFTAMFTHVGLPHLFLTLALGFGFCVSIERAVGSGKFLLGYLVSGLAAGAAGVLGSGVVTAGSSGAIYGVVGLTLVQLIHASGPRAVFAHPIGLRALVMIGLGLALSQTELPVNSVAHLGGLAAGVSLGVLYFKAAAWPPKVRIGAWVVALVLFVSLLVIACL
jgi:rhomboid protease GluP